MKLLALVLGVLGLGVLGLPLMVVAVVATHPWLAVSALTSHVEVVVPTPVVVAAPPAAPLPVTVGRDLSGAVDIARSWLGTPYLWGGCTRRGVDCSCFVHNVLAQFGINTPRTTVEQIRWATQVSRDQLQVGDIVFFNDTCRGCGANPTHEGLYIGAD